MFARKSRTVGVGKVTTASRLVEVTTSLQGATKLMFSVKKV